VVGVSVVIDSPSFAENVSAGACMRVMVESASEYSNLSLNPIGQTHSIFRTPAVPESRESARGAEPLEHLVVGNVGNAAGAVAVIG